MGFTIGAMEHALHYCMGPCLRGDGKPQLLVRHSRAGRSRVQDDVATAKSERAPNSL